MNRELSLADSILVRKTCESGTNEVDIEAVAAECLEAIGAA